MSTRGGPFVRRGASGAARGETSVWLMGAALVTCIVMIASLATLIVVQGGRTFWPGPIEHVTLASGETFLGQPMRRTGEDSGAGEVLYQVGNRDLGQDAFRWVGSDAIDRVERPGDAVMLERGEWWRFFGVFEAIVVRDAAGAETVHDGEDKWGVLADLLDQAEARRGAIRTMTGAGVGSISAEIDSLRVRLRQAEIELNRREESYGRLGWGAGGVLLALALAFGFLGAAVYRGVWIGARLATRWRAPACVLAWACALIAGSAAWLENPGAGGGMTPERFEQLKAETERRTGELGAEYDEMMSRVVRLHEEDARYRLVVRDPKTGRIAPESVSDPDTPLRLSQVYRVVRANDLTWGGRLGVYLGRWREFVTTEPREANTEGGVFPVIFGTVLLTILLSIAVVPLGVVAAIYLREYARQGLVVSLIRIAVNNLAGVPSIVYGVFGLGFFCYTLGRYVDRGPEIALHRGAWWALAVVLGAGVTSAVTLSGAMRERSGPMHGTTRAWWRFGLTGLWIGAGALALVVAARTPYFHGWYEARLPNPTFGTRGLLWASLTLALLTLPVVIVATEEAIVAVPRSAREGSYGCGASKWQTVRRIVLPGAMPGILTGTILAMARGAGEVAPLMLVGAVKLAPELPVSTEFPFLHLDRSFMHLGFHIFDLGFQSPDADAARPMVWTTTLILVLIVLVLNLSAVFIRARLRARLRSSHF